MTSFNISFSVAYFRQRKYYTIHLIPAREPEIKSLEKLPNVPKPHRNNVSRACIKIIPFKPLPMPGPAALPKKCFMIQKCPANSTV